MRQWYFDARNAEFRLLQFNEMHPDCHAILFEDQNYVFSVILLNKPLEITVQQDVLVLQALYDEIKDVPKHMKSKVAQKHV
jgi:hypothetical protein